MADSAIFRRPSMPKTNADDWFAQQGAPQAGPGWQPPSGPEIPPPGGYTDAWWQSLDPRERAWRESQAINEPTGRGGGPAPGAPPGGTPAPGGAGGGDTSPEAFGRQWLASGGQTVADLQAFVAQHPEFGVTLKGSKGEHIVFPNGRAFDGVLAAGAGGRGASFNEFKDNGPGGGGAPGDSLAALQSSPGYQFRLAEGQKALERSAAARGTLLTGGTLKGLTRYGQEYASGEYGNRYNQLMGLAQLGQSSAAGQANQNTAYANQAGNTMTDIGNAQAAGTVGRANAATNAINQGSNMAMLYWLYRNGGLGGGAGVSGLPGGTPGSF